MLHGLTSVCSMMRRNRAADYWHSLLTDPRSAVLLYHSDENVIALQRVLQDLRNQNTSYASSILFFMGGICLVEDNKILFSHVRAVLEIFILYSIDTSDLKWLSDDRAGHLSRSIEVFSSIGFQDQRPPLIAGRPLSIRYCLQASSHLKLLSRVEKCQAEIIQALVGLSETMRLDGALPKFDPENPRHQYNSAAVRKRLRVTDYYWISMAYCLAIEP